MVTLILLLKNSNKSYGKKLINYVVSDNSREELTIKRKKFWNNLKEIAFTYKNMVNNIRIITIITTVLNNIENSLVVLKYARISY